MLKTFRKFFAEAAPATVINNLELTRSQIDRYKPEAPADAAAPAGGHACLDASRPGILFLNQGVGATARMIAGADSLRLTPMGRAFNIVHEATHGAPALATVDNAYYWQRLFPYLSPPEQVRNADSYAMLVGRLAGLALAKSTMTLAEQGTKDMSAKADKDAVRTVGFGPDDQRTVESAWAWFEQYTTQAWLNVRDLYPVIAGHHQLIPGSYQARLWEVIDRVFHLGVGEFASVAGIIDRLDDLKGYANQTRPIFLAAEPEAEPDAFFAVLPGTAASQRGVFAFMWRITMATMPQPLPEPMKPQFETFLRDVARMSGWGGPLA